jgi:hypothetical protein
MPQGPLSGSVSMLALGRNVTTRGRHCACRASHPERRYLPVLLKSGPPPKQAGWGLS